MLSNYYQVSKSASDDVRRERVEHIKLMLTSGAYLVTTEEVAAKLIEYMLNLGRAIIPKEEPVEQKDEKQ
jgi:anti-sigma28 factor (negative regulator of flagellin synthesis)